MKDFKNLKEEFEKEKSLRINLEEKLRKCEKSLKNSNYDSELNQIVDSMINTKKTHHKEISNKNLKELFENELNDKLIFCVKINNNIHFYFLKIKAKRKNFIV